MLDKNIFLNKISSQKGICIKILDNLIFFNEKGESEEIKELNVQILGFYHLYNSSRKKSQNAKIFKNISDLIKDITFKLSTKTVGNMYHIVVKYRDAKSSIPVSERTVSHMVLCSIVKENNGIFMKNAVMENDKYKNIALSLQEKRNIMSNNKIPKSWIVEKEENPKIKELEDMLIKDYNVREISYKGSISIQDKEQYLKTLINCYYIMNKVVDVNKIPKVNILFQKLQTSNATYTESLELISLDKDSIMSLFHEFFHHIDAKIIKNTRANAYYKSLTKKLINNTTMTKFIEDTNITIKKSRSQKVSKLYVSNLKYYTAPEEMLARLFKDYCMYKYAVLTRKILNYPPKLSFYNQEIEECSNFLENFLDELGVKK